MPLRPPTKPSWHRNLAFAFAIGVACLALFVLLASLARVRVVLTPRVEPIAHDFEVTLVGSAPAPEGTILGRLARVDGTATVGPPPPLPTTRVPSGPPPDIRPARARGVVTLINTEPRAQPLVATTRLLSPSGVLFRLEKSATIPAKGKLERVPVYADQSGAAGNIGPTKFTIPGLSTWLRARVWAESVEPMRGGDGVEAVPGTGGGTTVVPGITNRDALLAIAKTTAEAQAKHDAEQRLRALVAEGEESWPIDTVVRTEIANGQARSTVTTTAVVVPERVLLDRAQAVLDRMATTSGRTLVRVRTDAIRTRVLRQDSTNGRVHLLLHVEGDTSIRSGYRSFDPNRLAGFTADGVRTYLRSIPGVADVEVTFWPFWVRTVPMNVGRVDVEVRDVPGTPTG